MDTAIVHNPKSGDGAVTADDLCHAVAAAGHEVLSYTSVKERRWRERIDTAADVVVAAGGDGTVRDVFALVAENGAVATVIALGTSNNIARTLGLPTRAPLDAISLWREGMVETRHQLLRVSADDRRELCTEGAGVGLFAELIRRADQTDPDTDDPWELLRGVVTEAPDEHWSVTIDGRDASASYLAVHATVIRHTGPNFLIAPEADPAAPGMVVVLIGTDMRQRLSDYVDARRRNEHPPTPRFDTVTARRVELHPPEHRTMSADDEVLDGTTALFVEARSDFARALVPRRPGLRSPH